MATEVRQGDSANISPCYAKLSDNTPINLTGASIWASVGVSRSVVPALTKKNAAGGGDIKQISDPADPTLGGPFIVYLTSADTALLTVNAKYYGDIRVKLTTGEVYTVGEFEFKVIDPYTAVPA